ncbi:hypothetical protein [Sphaerisporangium fuscum]|uniref:hypothetical protein n=1 Tax=Sphaerisporangium fuscum TaxID=2835868 RepID=UPI001BDD6968|nr:hypothetical protein [Sphaerisporangium fuscum]
MARRFSRTVLTIIAIVAVLCAAIFYGVYHLLNKARPYALGEHCQVRTSLGTLDLEIEQAQVAATIAAVATRRKLPERALEIAYITAIQESKLLNLPFGDRDSVGVFQQRPSQGWGTVKQLQDPVYASQKFFAALVKVRHYQKMPLHEAAQAVQRSADGSAYAQHEPDAKILAPAFTGRVPKAVHCWYPPPGKPVADQPAKARKELARALGPAVSGSSTASPGDRSGGTKRDTADPTGGTKTGAADPAARTTAGTGGTTASPAGRPTATTSDVADKSGRAAQGGRERISVSTERRGWQIASWSVAHAQKYGLREVRYGGVKWRSASGHDGWLPDSTAATTQVDLA